MLLTGTCITCTQEMNRGFDWSTCQCVCVVLITTTARGCGTLCNSTCVFSCRATPSMLCSTSSSSSSSSSNRADSQSPLRHSGMTMQDHEPWTVNISVQRFITVPSGVKFREIFCPTMKYFMIYFWNISKISRRFFFRLYTHPFNIFKRLTLL